MWKEVENRKTDKTKMEKIGRKEEEEENEETNNR